MVKKFSIKISVLLTLLILWVTFSGFPLFAETSVIVDPGIEYQTMEGWGTSLCWWGNVVGNYPDMPRKAIEDLIFDQSTGLRFNIARYNIGGGDAPSHNHMRSGGEMEGYETSFGVWNWNADAAQRKVLTESIRMGVNIVEAFSNAPPYWMTYSECASGNTSAGSDNLKSDQYDNFANYLTEVVKHFRDFWGITFRTLDPVNEPNTSYWGANGSQEGCHFEPACIYKFVCAVGASLSSKNLTGTKLSAPDESSLDTCVTDLNALDSTSLSYISQVNTHTYGGSNRTGVRDFAKAQGKMLWMSEVDGSVGTHNHNAIAPALWLANKITLDLKNLQPTAWVIWQAVENEQNMAAGREDKNWGLIHADFENGGSNYYVTKKYYAMGNYSKFIRPGYKMISVTNDKAVAFFSEAASTLVMVVVNDTTSDLSYTYDLTRFRTLGLSGTAYTTSATQNLESSSMTVSSKRFTATAKAQSIVTYVITGVKAYPLTYKKIINRNSGKALDVSESSVVDGASVIQYTYQGGANQQWYLADAGSGYYKIVNRKSGKLLDVNGASKANGTGILQWSENNGANQLWELVDAGNGYYKIKNRNSGKLLDVSGGSASDSANIIQYSDNGGTNQQWKVIQ